MNMTLYVPSSNTPRRGTSHLDLKKIISVLIFIYLLFIMPVYIDNNAGNGLAMPQNILTWGGMVLCILVILLNMVCTGKLRIAKFFTVALLAIIFMVLPFAWTSSPLWQRHALPRLAGIVGAFLFTFALFQISFSERLRRTFLVVIVLSALIQSVEAMVQAWMPELALRLMDFAGTSVYGVFQQRNLLASWLATGGGIALYLAVTARNRGMAQLWLLTLYPLCTAMVLSQSRAGAIGLLAIAIPVAILDLRRLRQRPLAALQRVIFVSSLITWCVGIGLWAMPSGFSADFIHSTSNEVRIRLLQGTLALISQHPLIGNGLGSFEAVFPQALDSIGLTIESDTISHPHNEILYVAAEGGIMAFAGFMLLVCIWLWPLVYRFCHQPDDSSRFGEWLLPLLGLPVVVHMMLEYPLYTSAPHLLILLLLFRIGVPEKALQNVQVPALFRWAVLPSASLASVAVLVVLYTGFTAQCILTQAEMQMNAGLIPTLPEMNWQSITQAERLDYDRHILNANTPGFSRDPRSMANFTIWGRNWLKVHNDAEVSAVMLLIARLRGDRVDAENLRRQAARVFVHDARFTREGG